MERKLEFLEYDLFSPALCLGERLKGALFRPCLKQAIPYSQITGALRRRFDGDVHAVGYFVEGNGFNRVQSLVYSPRDRVQGLSRLPLQAEFLADARGKVFVVKNKDTEKLPQKFELCMGALVSKGLGTCRLELCRVVQAEYGKDPGLLRTRLPLTKVQLFGIRRVLSPVYGYLFEPISATAGTYILAVFEGSQVVAPTCLISLPERRAEIG